MSFLDQLNPVQREAVSAVDGPVLIVAGAGSGKTRVLTYRAAHLVDLGISPQSILALTFTNKAAEEMKTRIAALVGEESRSIWMGTFHSIFARILRFEAERIGFQRNYTIYDTDDSLGLIRAIMNSLGIPSQQFSPQGVRSRISLAKNATTSPRAYREKVEDPMMEKTALIYEEYEKRLKKCNAMDFDDLLLKPLELFSRHKDVLERYQYRFRYLLVDEYQDTNRVQYRLLKDLAGTHHNICVVGDDAQSIYAFRGADIRNILDFEKDYPECRIFRLEENYRSTRTILAAADGIIRHNQDQIPKTLRTANEAGDLITLQTCDDDRDEGYKVVAAIQEESLRRKLDLKDFAVLYRTNAQSRSIEDALRRSGIPYLIVGGVAFYKRKEIKDILSYLGVIANPADAESLLRVINVPARGIGETTVARLRALADEKKASLLHVLTSPDLQGVIADRTLKAVRQFHDLVMRYINLKGEMSVGELARALVDDIGILQVLKEENTAESLNRRDNVLELVSALAEFSARQPEAGLEEFLAEVSLVSDVDTAEFGRNAVTLMTLHAAKGLEFPVVFITGLEEGLFPLGGADLERKEMEEERRLMYVGVTRAKQKLYLSWAVTRYRFGELSPSSRSRFLGEIDDALFKPEAGGRPGGRPYRRHPAMPGGIPAPRRQRVPADDSAKYFSDVTPAYENESQETFNARVGLRVVHEDFGAGRILALDGRGENARAIVEFDSVGRKHLMLKYANLRPQ
ncbi:MAG TPA: UvrD-helicase domain-containing protein [Bacteroidota bacterium]|nr:UvrD-helicase domain-containing protein [Bacteroidota bacterium]